MKTPLWWRAKAKADKGYLDALNVSGEDCGCVRPQSRPDAPYRVSGYNMDCDDYDIPFNTFVKAASAFLRRSRAGDVVGITGVSAAVNSRLQQMAW